MFKYNLINTQAFSINEIIVKNIFTEITKVVEKGHKGTLNIIFVDSEEIKGYNKKYRGINKETDVLSFHYFDDFSSLNLEEIAGEIIMCKEKIIFQAKQFGLGQEKEFYKLLIHSVLHILGYDHEKDKDYKIMKSLEDKIWKII